MSFLPDRLYGQQWAVNFEDHLDGIKPESYHIVLKEGNETYSAVYNKAGKLVSSKQIIKEALLPDEVRMAIKKMHPGFQIEKEREKITYKNGTLKEVYRIQIEEEGIHRVLYIDPTGKILHDRVAIV